MPLLSLRSLWSNEGFDDVTCLTYRKGCQKSPTGSQDFPKADVMPARRARLPLRDWVSVGTNGALVKAEERPVAAILVVALALAALYWFPMRRWFGSWGTAPTDRTRVMAGDGAVVEPTYSATLAITVDCLLYTSPSPRDS